MKLEKITQIPGRSYRDACGTAQALDLVGERWAMLVMRELMLGPRRFRDLRDSLPGISANVLTQRLEGLEAGGVLRRRKLAPPASVQVYELTDWGREAEPIILSLGRWGARSPRQDVTLPLSAVSMALSFRAMFDAAKAKSADVTGLFDTGAEAFTFTIREGGLKTERGRAGPTDFEMSGPPGKLAGAVYGIVPASAFDREGVVFRGDSAAFERFATAFALPTTADISADA